MINYYKEIFLYVKKTVLDKNVAEDITQEAFVRVIKNTSNKKIENERAFLYRVAKNIIIDQFRKRTKVTEVCFNDIEYFEEDNQTQDKIIQDDQQLHLMIEIDKLAKKRKQAFVLHIIEGYSRKEVAAMMNLSLNSVEKHISRASNQIKENMRIKEGKDSE
ncbi:MAG: RNA polymerase sigma factor [Campylobacteraceae bacterium]|nr:RNA polymerase sigma factor [Campylobacteraceae bacterium]